MGTIGGGVFQSIKGFRNAPSVRTTRFIFAVKGLLMNHFIFYRDFKEEHLEV